MPYKDPFDLPEMRAASAQTARNIAAYRNARPQMRGYAQEDMWTLPHDVKDYGIDKYLRENKPASNPDVDTVIRQQIYGYGNMPNATVNPAFPGGGGKVDMGFEGHKAMVQPMALTPSQALANMLK